MHSNRDVKPVATAYISSAGIGLSGVVFWYFGVGGRRLVTAYRQKRKLVLLNLVLQYYKIQACVAGLRLPRAMAANSRAIH